MASEVLICAGVSVCIMGVLQWAALGEGDSLHMDKISISSLNSPLIKAACVSLGMSGIGMQVQVQQYTCMQA